MKKQDKKSFYYYLGIILGLLIIAGVYVASWLATCGIIYLITLCFGWTFKWSTATGFWLLMYLFNITTK